MNRKDLDRRLLRLLGPDGLEAASVDLARLEDEGELPEWLRRLVVAAEELPLPEVPAMVSQDLRDIFNSGDLVEPHAGVLVRDTRVDKQLVGARGADVAEGWSMTYTSPVADVVLDVWPQRGEEVEVVGHVMGHGRSETAYRARLTGPVDVAVDTDRLGRFRLRGIAPGSYTLVIANRQVELTLEADLGEV